MATAFLTSVLSQICFNNLLQQNLQLKVLQNLQQHHRYCLSTNVIFNFYKRLWPYLFILALSDDSHGFLYCFLPDGASFLLKVPYNKLNRYTVWLQISKWPVKRVSTVCHLKVWVQTVSSYRRYVFNETKPGGFQNIEKYLQ